MQGQAKFISGDCSTTQGGERRTNISAAKKRLTNGEEMNTLVVSAVDKSTKTTYNFKAKDTAELENDTEVEHFNFEHLNIRTCSNYEWGKSRRSV